jgi:hypothetical protein
MRHRHACLTITKLGNINHRDSSLVALSSPPRVSGYIRSENRRRMIEIEVVWLQ